VNNFDMIFDIKTYRFTHPESGFVINGEDVMMLKNDLLIDIIEAGTGVVVDDLYIEVLRDTVESIDGNAPW
jgi:hypothetical protein